MHELALRYQQGPVSLKSVAERQSISEHYLEQLIAPLRKAGLVQSVRGAQGGYELAREPAEITIGDILRVLEGPIAPVDCLDHNDSGACCRADGCAARTVWKRLQDSMTDVLDSTTLADLCRTGSELSI